MWYSHSKYAWPLVWPFKVKVDGVIGKPIYDFLLVNNSKYIPICSTSQDIATQNMHDLEFGQGMSSYEWITVNICLSAVF